ncbi:MULTISPECIES: rhomboid family intramembrane serine protease [Larkinella]|uniref:Rhomboid family intramembrane serine protease n=1 Tax=Larkinella punicea TaxID=2315727 RepID=A0A368JND7_9BACT|nr:MULTISPECIES: rhomboid family intramembrane serine protease [Larkinella]RCR68093.1 rhomboid family intramembrane serine protease [Larkinella punicea]
MNLTPVVRTLLLINVGLFIVKALGIDLISTFGLYSFLSPAFAPHQFVTYMFLHADFGHIFSNMLGLFFFGPMLEQVWGSKRFTIFYFITGVGAGLLFLGINYFEASQLRDAVAVFQSNPTPESLELFLSDRGLLSQGDNFLRVFEDNPTDPAYRRGAVQLIQTYYEQQLAVPMVGASGAIFGILMAFGLLFPNTELFLLFPPIPIKAKYLVAFYGAYELYSGIYRAQSDNVAHFAHIGGMLFAFILVKYWGKQRNNFY